MDYRDYYPWKTWTANEKWATKVDDIKKMFGDDGSTTVSSSLTISTGRITAPMLNTYHIPEIRRVIFNYPATIILWCDGTKTVVKLMEGDTWDPEKGFAMAYLKKILGTSKLRKEIKTWVKPQEEQEKDCEILVNAMKNMHEYANICDAVSNYLKKVFKQGDKMTADSEDK